MFMNQRKVEIIEMPLLVAEIKQIEEALEKIENWTDPVARKPAVPQPVIHSNRRQSPPRRNASNLETTLSRNLKKGLISNLNHS